MMMMMMTTTTLSGKKGTTIRLFTYTPKSTDRSGVCTFTQRAIIYVQNYVLCKTKYVRMFSRR